MLLNLSYTLVIWYFSMGIYIGQNALYILFGQIRGILEFGSSNFTVTASVLAEPCLPESFVVALRLNDALRYCCWVHANLLCIESILSLKRCLKKSSEFVSADRWWLFPLRASMVSQKHWVKKNMLPTFGWWQKYRGEENAVPNVFLTKISTQMACLGWMAYA